MWASDYTRTLIIQEFFPVLVLVSAALLWFDVNVNRKAICPHNVFWNTKILIIKIIICLYPSYRHNTVFTISPIPFSTKTEEKINNIMVLRHCVRKENGDDFNIWMQFIVCYSTKQHNLHWNLYIYNWSKQYQTKMHQNNITSIMVDPTPSRFIKSTPTWFSNLCTQIWGFQR
jgi:hypothetical protein